MDSETLGPKRPNTEEFLAHVGSGDNGCDGTIYAIGKQGNERLN